MPPTSPSSPPPPCCAAARREDADWPQHRTRPPAVKGGLEQLHRWLGGRRPQRRSLGVRFPTHCCLCLPVPACLPCRCGCCPLLPANCHLCLLPHNCISFKRVAPGSDPFVFASLPLLLMLQLHLHTDPVSGVVGHMPWCCWDGCAGAHPVVDASARSVLNLMRELQSHMCSYRIRLLLLCLCRPYYQ